MYLRIIRNAVAASILLSAGQAFAEDSPRWYIALEGAQTRLSSTDIQRTTHTNQCNPLGCNIETVESKFRGRFDSTRDYRLGIGYQLSEAVRAEISYSSESVGLDFSETDLDVDTLTISLWQTIDYQLIGFSPYYGGSLLVGEMELDDADSKFVGVQLGLGVSYTLTERLTFDLGYRYFMAEPDIQLEGGSFDTRKDEYVLDYRGSSLNLGLRFLLF